jgi:hypothetical protein
LFSIKKGPIGQLFVVQIVPKFDSSATKLRRQINEHSAAESGCRDVI